MVTCLPVKEVSLVQAQSEEPYFIYDKSMETEQSKLLEQEVSAMFERSDARAFQVYQAMLDLVLKSTVTIET